MNLSDLIEVALLLLNTVCMVMRALSSLALRLQILALQRAESQRVVKYFVLRVRVLTPISLIARAEE